MSDLYLFNIEKGEIMTHFNNKTLPALYPELQSGIYKFQYEQDKQYIQVTAKNGKVYYITPYDGKITSQIPAKPVIASKFLPEYDHERYNRNITFRMNLVSKEGQEKITVLEDRTGKILNNSLEFVEGKMFHIFNDSDRFVVLHYTNTDETTFILTCFSADLKKIWEIRQTELDADVWLIDEKLDVSAIYRNQIIFNSGGFAFAINQENGKIIWKKHL